MPIAFWKMLGKEVVISRYLIYTKYFKLVSLVKIKK